MTGVIVTGGPGSGKTTLIEALAATGRQVQPEAGRAVIRRQQIIDGQALPWRDRALFAELMLDRDLEAHGMSAAAPGIVFHDRGLPDLVGYLELCGLAPPDHFLTAARERRYARRVFIAPVWPEIFGQDAERRQDLEEARRTHEAMRAVYPRFGYELVELPKASVEVRVAFILDQVRPET